MWFSRKQGALSQPASQPVDARDIEAPAPTGARVGLAIAQPTTKSRGDAAESEARAFLTRAGLKFIDANFKTPGRGGGEIDLVMRAPDGTLVFVEVRQRASASHGGAAASISPVKQRRIIFAAQHYLMRFASAPPCRFDVVLVQGGGDSQQPVTIEWLQAAFDAS
jgi:putative endonuclease